MTVNSALQGANISTVSRRGDLSNRLSIGSVGVFLAKDRFKENNPYSKEYDSDGNLTIYINLHFYAELRRQLSGDGAVGTSTFSPTEKAFYEEFQEWQMGVPKYGNLLVALEALDDWLVDEVTNTKHPILNRDYETTHRWRKTDEYVHEKGILWI